MPGAVAPGAVGARVSMPPETAPATPDAAAEAALGKIPRKWKPEPSTELDSLFA